MRFIRYLFLLKRFIFVKMFAWIFYDKKYLKTKWFSAGLDAPGWQWATRDIHYRLSSLGHLGIRWPVSPNIEVGGKIEFDPNDLDNMNGFGNYYQTIGGKIIIGSGTCIAPNVGIITTNHDIQDCARHLSGKDVIIEKNVG